MNILVTGATGYIGARLIPFLLENGHTVYALVRNKKRITDDRIKVIDGDIVQGTVKLPSEIDAAFYLIHSMSADANKYDEMDKVAAGNFVQSIEKTACKQIVYLSGIVNDKNLSKHLQSRAQVDEILRRGKVPVTTLKAGIIIGSGSASFEIIRDLVEKLPIMMAPRWLNSKCQPIALSDVVHYLVSVLGNEKCLGQGFDIGGPDTLTYKEMLYGYAAVRGLRRFIITVPVLTPRLSSYWLFLITTAPFQLGMALAQSLKNDAICKDTRIQEIINHRCIGYQEALKKALSVIEENAVISSWRDSWNTKPLEPELQKYVQVPEDGAFVYTTNAPFTCSIETVTKRIFSIGGPNGWYGMDWAWRVRGIIDRLFGGVGLRRGKTERNKLMAGDALDFWRVLLADYEAPRLLLLAEMKLPGEAWLEILAKDKEVIVKATFRPHGLWGRVYWYLFYPFHLIIFPGIAKAISRDEKG